MCFNAKLKILEHRQQRIAEVRAKYEWLMKELETTKQYLMLDPNKWLSECKARGSCPRCRVRRPHSQGETDTDRPRLCPIPGASDAYRAETSPLSMQSRSLGDRWDWWGQQSSGEYRSREIISYLSQSRAPANEISPLLVAEDHPDVKAVLQICSEATKSHCISSLK